MMNEVKIVICGSSAWTIKIPTTANQQPVTPIEKFIINLGDERDKLRTENELLCSANDALVSALDRIKDILNGDEAMNNADIGISEIVNKAIDKHRRTI